LLSTKAVTIFLLKAHSASDKKSQMFSKTVKHALFWTSGWKWSQILNWHCCVQCPWDYFIGQHW